MADFKSILLCCDLDRTLIPNGYQEESSHARPVFRRLVKHSKIYLAYVSGRDKNLIVDAIEEYHLPMPNFAIADIGTTLYRIIDGRWQFSNDWQSKIAQDWKGVGRERLSEYFENMEEIQPQELAKQSPYKLSYYTDQQIDHLHLIKKIRCVLERKGIHANIIWSVDEISSKGLLDIIPARANKLHAIQFIMQQEQFAYDRTVFAGDSGNDMDVLTSGMQAILVKNAADVVRQQAIETLSRQNMTDCLYLPKGSFYGMNGNYAAGLIEGLVHYVPESDPLIARAMQSSNKLLDGENQDIL